MRVGLEIFRASGGCLCGAIRYSVFGRLRPVVNCHCEQCRRFHGHFAAYTCTEREGLQLSAHEELRWYRSSKDVHRGFCSKCGSSLFWHRRGSRFVGIAAGTVDQPSDLQTIGHEYVEPLADYYQIIDALKQTPRDFGDEADMSPATAEQAPRLCAELRGCLPIGQTPRSRAGEGAGGPERARPRQPRPRGGARRL